MIVFKETAIYKHLCIEEKNTGKLILTNQFSLVNVQLIILLVLKDIDVYSESKLEIVSPDYKMYDLFLIVALLYELRGVLITSHSKHNIKVL